MARKKGWSSDEVQAVATGTEAPLFSSKVVAMGASTGGPRTLLKVLGALPADFPCPILLVQHMSQGFMKGFAEWLGKEISLKVHVVDEAVRLEPGHVYIPPDGYHLEVARGAAVLREGPPVNACRPSVDVLFHSLARECKDQGVAVLLTGMGRDGAEGALAIHKAGGKVIVQDEETSIIYGMPKAAVDLEAADRVEPLQRIPAALIESVRGEPVAELKNKEAVADEILVVDDSPTMLALVSDILISHGYRVRQAENGKIALDEIARSRPDLVLLDVMMPEMDGYTVCQHMRKDREYIPVLMITAKGEPHDLVRGIESGADDYISKPFEEMELVARIKSLLRIRTLQKRLYRQNSELEAKNRELERLAQALDRANKELTLLSVTDGLTRAYNHRHFQERLRAEFSRAERYNTLLSCILIDIDHFKQVNDTYGHPVGDQVLVRMVELLQESVRNEDLVARYGGEEFVVLLPETGGARALTLAQRIRERIEREKIRVGDSTTLRVTVSLGVAQYEPAGGNAVQTPDKLIGAADEALYRAKANGRNRAELA
jgi:diguanylate cyclase (GGDEF)-like protein